MRTSTHIIAILIFTILGIITISMIQNLFFVTLIGFFIGFFYKKIYKISESITNYFKK